jgi:hypothetical protein
MWRNTFALPSQKKEKLRKQVVTIEKDGLRISIVRLMTIPKKKLFEQLETQRDCRCRRNVFCRRRCSAADC